MFLNISQNSQENNCVDDFFFDKVACLGATTLNEIPTQVFSVNFAIFLITPFSIEHLQSLVLRIPKNYNSS